MQVATNQIELQALLNEYAALPEYFGCKSIEVNQVSLFGDRPINIAATRGVLAEIDILLKNGVNINNKGEHGYTPLHNAVEQGHIAAVLFLLDRGANKFIVNDDFQTAGDLAVLLGEHSLVQVLNQSN